MARDFSPISFFQRTPKVLLGRYFQDRHGVLKEIAFAELEETGSTAGIIFEAFRACRSRNRRGSRRSARTSNPWPIRPV